MNYGAHSSYKSPYIEEAARRARERVKKQRKEMKEREKARAAEELERDGGDSQVKVPLFDVSNSIEVQKPKRQGSPVKAAAAAWSAATTAATTVRPSTVPGARGLTRRTNSSVPSNVPAPLAHPDNSTAQEMNNNKENNTTSTTTVELISPEKTPFQVGSSSASTAIQPKYSNSETSTNQSATNTDKNESTREVSPVKARVTITKAQPMATTMTNSSCQTDMAYCPSERLPKSKLQPSGLADLCPGHNRSGNPTLSRSTSPFDDRVIRKLLSMQAASSPSKSTNTASTTAMGAPVYTSPTVPFSAPVESSSYVSAPLPPPPPADLTTGLGMVTSLAKLLDAMGTMMAAKASDSPHKHSVNIPFHNSKKKRRQLLSRKGNRDISFGGHNRYYSNENDHHLEEEIEESHFEEAAAEMNPNAMDMSTPILPESNVHQEISELSSKPPLFPSDIVTSKAKEIQPKEASSKSTVAKMKDFSTLENSSLLNAAITKLQELKKVENEIMDALSKRAASTTNPTSAVADSNSVTPVPITRSIDFTSASVSASKHAVFPEILETHDISRENGLILNLGRRRESFIIRDEDDQRVQGLTVIKGGISDDVDIYSHSRSVNSGNPVQDKYQESIKEKVRKGLQELPVNEKTAIAFKQFRKANAHYREIRELPFHAKGVTLHDVANQYSKVVLDSIVMDLASEVDSALGEMSEKLVSKV